jgi:hypothetical protein
MLNGELMDEFIEEYLDKVRKEKIDILLKNSSL